MLWVCLMDGKSTWICPAAASHSLSEKNGELRAPRRSRQRSGAAGNTQCFKGKLWAVFHPGYTQVINKPTKCPVWIIGY